LRDCVTSDLSLRECGTELTCRTFTPLCPPRAACARERDSPCLPLRRGGGSAGSCCSAPQAALTLPITGRAAQRDAARPESAAVEGEAESIGKLADRVLIYRGHLRLTSDATTLHYAYMRELLRDGALVRTRTWSEDIPRDLQ